MAKLSNNNFFIEIENTSLSPISIDAMIKTRRNQEKTITPELALDILRYTNHLGNIKPILKEIQKLPLEEQLKYKEFVLSAISHRIHSEQTQKVLYTLASNLGYEDVFESIDEIPKLYFPISCKVFECTDSNYQNENFSQYDTILRHNKIIINFVKCILPQYVSLVNVDNILFLDCDFDNTREINFATSESIQFQECQKLPQKIDASQNTNLDFWNCNLSDVREIITAPQMSLKIRLSTNLPKNIHLKDLCLLQISSYLDKTEELIIEDTQKVYLEGTTNTPIKISITNASEVNFTSAYYNIKELNLKNIKNIYFNENRDIKENSTIIFPETLDLSTCDEIIFKNFPLGEIKELKFGKKHHRVNLERSISMPKSLDLSGAEQVFLAYANCQGLEEIKFAQNATISLYQTHNLPKKLDVSMCKDIKATDCDFSGVEQIIAKNQEQISIILKNPTFKGKVKYKSNKEKTNLLISQLKNILNKGQ